MRRLEDLRDALRRPPWLLEPINIWRAYKRLNDARVRGNPRASSPISSCWCASRSGRDEVLEPLPSKVAGKFNLWLGREQRCRARLFRRATGVADRDPRSLGRQCGSDARDLQDVAAFGDKGGLVQARGRCSARGSTKF